MKKINYLLSVPSDIGAQKMGTALAIDALLVADAERQESKLSTLEVEEIFSKPQQRGKFGHVPFAKYIDDIIEISDNTCAKIATLIQSANKMPLVISGDHSNAIGIMAGIREGISTNQKLGVLWIDAHADLHTPYTTPSGNFHGMSLATCMGFDNKELARNDISREVYDKWENLKKCGNKNLSPKIYPEDVYFIGLRDFEIQEYHLIRDFNLKHSSPYDIKTKGLQTIIDDVLDYCSNYDAIYVSFDVDVLDTTISTGTGTPVYNGLMLEEAKQLVTQLKSLDNIVLWEFTEINPLLDNKNSMCKAVLELVDILLD